MEKAASHTHDTALSRRLSKVLRHSALKEGLEIGKDGYVLVEDLLKLPTFRARTFSEIETVVQENDKKRFSLVRRSDNRWYIRANQGHSIKLIDESLLLHKIHSSDEAPCCVHGTYLKNWDAIRRQGLRVMKRNHIHFAPGLPKEKSVISGMRGNADIAIYIDVEMAMSEGIEFYKSANNVILSRGIEGVIPPRYFREVVNLKTNQTLLAQKMPLNNQANT